MVKHEKSYSKMQSTYYLKPGQTLNNTKIAERSLALTLSKRAFERFVDYTTENDRLAAAADEEAFKLAALKKATYEMSKSWDDTFANIQKRRKEEMLNRSKRDEDAREKLLEELKARNAIERAKIVNEARKLLLWKKPQCRLINRALLTSECYRQLDAQTTFNKTLRDIDRERDAEYATMIKKEAEKSIEEEKNKDEERMRKNRIYGEQLKKQIEGMGNDAKRIELQELNNEKQDLKDMAREIRMLEECESEQTFQRKKELKKMFTTALEDEKRRETEMRRNEEFENRAIEVFARSKDRIKKIGKSRTKEAMDEKIRCSDLFAKKCAAVQNSRESAEEESRRRAILEKEESERERIEAKKKHEEKIRADMERYKEELATIKEHRANEEKNMIAWETLQRFKRDEYNKEIQLVESKRQWNKKNETANYLRKQMAEREAERKSEVIMGNDAIQTRRIIDSTNERVLAYGEQVLKECRELNESDPKGPARPLFPILKAIETFKKDCGLISPKKYEESVPPKRERRKRRVCPKTVLPEQICYV